jgi:2-polyprenyl-3-methyl-5-hydroxy-6-metoxy-1,4-benzoquinol methylase
VQHTAYRPFYEEYAWAYDLLISRPVSHHCGCMAELFSQRGIGPGARLLDVGCGTGRYALELARRGYMVTGLDLSTSLLAEAQKRIRTTALSIALVCGNMLALPFASQYDALLCRGVLNDLLETPSRQAVFVAFASALRPGGVLLCDVREWHATVHRKSQEPVFEKSLHTPRGTLTYHSVTQLDHQHHQLRVAERHVLAHNGSETVADYDFTMRCWTQEEIQRSLTQAGFGSVVYLGDYESTVPVGATDRLVSIASRSG